MIKDRELIGDTSEYECVDDVCMSTAANNEEYNEEMSLEERLLVLKCQNDKLQEQVNSFADILSHFQREHEYSISKEILESKEACMAITNDIWNSMLVYYANTSPTDHPVRFIYDMMRKHRRTWPRKPTARQAAHALKLLAEYTEYVASIGLDCVACEASTVQSPRSEQLVRLAKKVNAQAKGVNVGSGKKIC